MKRLFACALVALVLVGFQAALAEGIRFAEPSLTIDLWGERSVSLKCENDTARPLKFRIDDKRVASVTKRGKLTAKRKGTALVTAYNERGSATLALSVVRLPAPKTLRLQSAAGELLAVGEKRQLSLGVSPEGSSRQVRYTSSNAKVVKVSKAGVVTGIRPGKATVSAISRAKPGVRAKLSLRVEKAAAPYTPSASPLHGVCFGPYLTGPVNAPLSDARIKALLAPIRGKAVWIRTYGAAGDLGKVPGIARSMGFKVMAGAWLSGAAAANVREIAALKALIKAGQLDCAVVGNETQLRPGELTLEQLIAHIEDVRAYARSIGSDVPVCTADAFTSYEQNPALIQASDWVLAHIYPYWDSNVPDERAIPFLREKAQLMLDLSGGKPVVIGETGWPSGSDDPAEASATPAKASSYFQESVRALREMGLPYFVFELYDEDFKQEGNGVGNHFGIFDTQMNEKYPGALDALTGGK